MVSEFAVIEGRTVSFRQHFGRWVWRERASKADIGLVAFQRLELGKSFGRLLGSAVAVAEIARSAITSK